MPWPKGKPARQAGQALEACVHGVGVGPGQVRAATAFQEQRVPGHEVVVDHEALAPRSVTGRMERPHGDSTHRQGVVVHVRHHRRRGHTCHLGDPLDLLFLDMNWYVGDFEQVDEALDMFAQDLTPDVVGVVVGSQDPHQAQPGAGEPCDQGVDVVGRIDEQDLAGRGVPDHIHVIAHRGGEAVAHSEVSPGEELTEEEALWHAAMLSHARSGPSPMRPLRSVPSHILVRMTDEPCLLTVHAHPDDEASKGAGTVARYHAEGVRCVLVCCTGGEEGEILNPAMNRPEIVEHLAEVRAAELQRSAEVIGYDEVVMLGYRDSGMPDSEANRRPDCFARAPLEEAAARLVAVVRRVRPQVMAIYPAHQSMYPHPDHIRAHEVGLAAFQAAGDPDAFARRRPGVASRRSCTTCSGRRNASSRWSEKFKELGMELPWGEERLEMMAAAPQEEVTTEVDIEPWANVRDDALRAHATQVDPSSPFWFGLPAEVAAELGHYEEYHLAHNLTSSQPPEDDLFAGITERAPL